MKATYVPFERGRASARLEALKTASFRKDIMMIFYTNNKRRFKVVFVIIAAFALAYIFVEFVFGYIWPFVLAILLSALFEPLVSVLNRTFKISRAVGTLISICFFILSLSFLGSKLVSKINLELSVLTQSIDTFYIENLIQNFKFKLDNLLPVYLPFNDHIYSFVMANLPTLFSGEYTEVKLISSVSKFIVGIVVCIISCFFFTKDKPLISDWIRKLILSFNFKNILIVKQGLVLALSAYVKAQLIIMCVTASICLIGFSLVDLPYALIGSLIVAIVDAIPVFGSGLFLLPAAIYSFIMAQYSNAIVFTSTYAAIFISRQIIEPKIISNKIGVHPLATIVSIYVGLNLFGILGLIIAPIIVISIKTLIDSESAFHLS